MGICVSSGAATTASRLGQPDLAIATLNDFVQVSFQTPVPSQPHRLTHAISPRPPRQTERADGLQPGPHVPGHRRRGHWVSGLS